MSPRNLGRGPLARVFEFTSWLIWYSAAVTRHIVGVGPPSAAELNEANRRAWAGSAASGQMRDDTA
jgi:hypothetical protein